MLAERRARPGEARAGAGVVDDFADLTLREVGQVVAARIPRVLETQRPASDVRAAAHLPEVGRDGADRLDGLVVGGVVVTLVAVHPVVVVVLQAPDADEVGKAHAHAVERRAGAGARVVGGHADVVRVLGVHVEAAGVGDVVVTVSVLAVVAAGQEAVNVERPAVGAVAPERPLVGAADRATVAAADGLLGAHHFGAADELRVAARRGHAPMELAAGDGLREAVALVVGPLCRLHLAQVKTRRLADRQLARREVVGAARVAHVDVEVGRLVADVSDGDDCRVVLVDPPRVAARQVTVAPRVAQGHVVGPGRVGPQHAQRPDETTGRARVGDLHTHGVEVRTPAGGEHQRGEVNLDGLVRRERERGQLHDAPGLAVRGPEARLRRDRRVGRVAQNHVWDGVLKPQVGGEEMLLHGPARVVEADAVGEPEPSRGHDADSAQAARRSDGRESDGVGRVALASRAPEVSGGERGDINLLRLAVSELRGRAQGRGRAVAEGEHGRPAFRHPPHSLLHVGAAPVEDGERHVGAAPAPATEQRDLRPHLQHLARIGERHATPRGLSAVPRRDQFLYLHEANLGRLEADGVADDGLAALGVEGWHDFHHVRAAVVEDDLAAGGLGQADGRGVDRLLRRLGAGRTVLHVGATPADVLGERRARGVGGGCALRLWRSRRGRDERGSQGGGDEQE